MLPGIRFLFVATVMSVSVLVFALGAAALLRATHENFATLPQRRPPEQVFVRADTARPVIALLRVEAEPETASIAAPATPPVVPRDENAIAESKSETIAAPAQAAEPVPASPETKTASTAPSSDTTLPGALAALNTELAALAAQRSTTPEAASPTATEAPARAVAEAPSVAAAAAQPAAEPDQAATTGSVKVAALSDGGDVIARIADARKKAEAAAQIRTRNLEAARRARAAKVAAQRRRIAIVRAREAKQRQQQEQQPFAPLFNSTN